MYTYFIILNDFGIRPGNIWGVAILENPFPRVDDIYDMT